MVFHFFGGGTPSPPKSASGLHPPWCHKKRSRPPWWRSMSSTLPCLPKQADRMLRLTLTAIQVESSFSTYTATCNAQQWSMNDDTHVTRMSCSFNGVLPQQEGSQTSTEGELVRKQRPPVRRKSQYVTMVEYFVDGLTNLPLGAGLAGKVSGKVSGNIPRGGG